MLNTMVSTKPSREPRRDLTLDVDVLVLHVVILGLDFGFPDGLVAYNPCHLLHDIGLGHGRHGREHQRGKRKYLVNFHYIAY